MLHIDPLEKMEFKTLRLVSFTIIYYSLFNFFLVVEILYHSPYSMAVAMDIFLFNFSVVYLLIWGELVQLIFILNLILYLSNSQTQI